MKRLLLIFFLASASVSGLRAQDSLVADTMKNEIQASILPLLQAATGSFSTQPGLGIWYKRHVGKQLWLRAGFSNRRLGGNGSIENYSIIGFDDSTEIRKYESYGQYWRNQFHAGVEFKLGNTRVRQYVGADLIGGWFKQQYSEYTMTYERSLANGQLMWQPVSGSGTQTLQREVKYGFGGISAFYGIQFLLTQKLYMNTQFQADARFFSGKQTDTVGGVSTVTDRYSQFDFTIPGLLGDIAIGCRF